ncbi:hypothetical protein [uncultured Tateyamaria sp.]|uniref:hypothetical protein n=1 Tax=uncultured Tateyamaria sp. TaxID=455651 RepID=UPI002633544E|nr:hypothetical protein [uncultured Tateyamaria sp.]
MDDPTRFTSAEMLRLARSAVHKIDLLGPRGTTLCSMDEIDAMACLLVQSGALTPPPDPTMTRAEQHGSLAQALLPKPKNEDQS